MRVREPAAERRSDQRADAVQHQHHGHPALAEAGDVGQQRRQVGEEAERAGREQRGRGHREPHLRIAVDAELGAQGGPFRRVVPGRGAGHEQQDADQTEHGHQRHRPERGPPPEALPQRRAAGHARDVRDAQPADHHGHGARAGVRGHQRDGDGGAHGPEPGAGQRAHHPADEEDRVAGRDRPHHVSEREHGEQPDERQPPRQPLCRGGQHRGADDHADGEGRYQQAGVGYGDVQIVGDLGQQAGQHELGRPQCKNGGSDDVDGDGQAVGRCGGPGGGRGMS